MPPWRVTGKFEGYISRHTNFQGKYTYTKGMLNGPSKTVVTLAVSLF